MTFFCGQKVTLKQRQTWDNALPNETMPKFGRVYTIRAMATRCGRTGLWFEEIINPNNYDDTKWAAKECAFPQEYFRPVVARPTSIEIFKRMLPLEPLRREHAFRVK